MFDSKRENTETLIPSIKSAYVCVFLINDFLAIYILCELIMAFGGPPSSSNDISEANALAHHLGQVTLDCSPMLSTKLSKPARNYSLRELEIMATIGTL